MQVKLVGIQQVNFTSNTGETIKGTNLFVLFKDPNVEGAKCDRLYLKEGIDLPKDVKINDTLEIFFDMRGKTERISKV